MSSAPDQKYPPARVIGVDVDGTLLVDGEPNAKLIDWCQARKAQGYYLMLWSARGEAHAREAAALCAVTGLFDLICSKPGYIVDDQGWGWVKYTREVHGLIPGR